MKVIINDKNESEVKIKDIAYYLYIIFIIVLLFASISYVNYVDLNKIKPEDIRYKFYSSQLKNNGSILISECIKYNGDKCLIYADSIITDTDELKILIYGK